MNFLAFFRYIVNILNDKIDLYFKYKSNYLFYIFYENCR